MRANSAAVWTADVGGRLEGKVAIVTGAGSVGPGWGNGRAIAVLFARAGAGVLAVDRDSGLMAGTLDLVEEGTAVPYECDVTSGASVRAMTAACLETFGRIDILVNNVGGSHHGGPVELDEQTWHAQLDTNLKSAYLTCKQVIPIMREQGGGAIVNIASTSGLRYTGAPQVAYASAKAGLIQLSRVTAVQHAPDGIRVNTVVPGQLHTPMVEARLAGQRAGGDVAELLRQRQSRIPLGFMGDGRDTAHAALFLASDEARFITGTELVVDGGMTARCD
ncbi:SDR family NAD(P)-dependent oxidoreductase [Nonomuraea sp. CA-143628]|uniref:SDR family NAD(P)-dependent oxidoreductase n=1 Tax=Nonomuraea sp. CA-143628 TaxID=3239997 RepID=UPI003D900304